jgi:secondary thiamine-phosphate synthase enzyme
MELRSKRFSVASEGRLEVLNVTPELKAAVAELEATDGLVLASTPHTSAALSTNEYDEPLLEDMIATFTDLVPPNDGYFHDLEHIREGEAPNAHAHLISAMIKRPVLLLLEQGELGLGTWEEVLFFELCGPRKREVEVTVLE